MNAFDPVAAALERRPEPIGLHGLKLRWLGPTLRDGLRRPDAAWFVLHPGASVQELRATFLAAIYFGLSLRGCEELAARTGSGEIARWLASDAGATPVLLLLRGTVEVADDALDRYEVLVPGARWWTSPYTKAARAGVAISADLLGPAIVPAAADVAVAEARAGRGGEGTRPVAKCTLDGTRIETPRGDGGRVGRFCLELACALAPAVARSVIGVDRLASVR
jgi:hypothetical protein